MKSKRRGEIVEQLLDGAVARVVLAPHFPRPARAPLAGGRLPFQKARRMLMPGRGSTPGSPAVSRRRSTVNELPGPVEVRMSIVAALQVRRLKVSG